MKPVDSVGQISNYRSITMEKQASAMGGDDDGDQRDSSNSKASAARQVANAEPQAAEKKAQVPDYLRAIGMDPRKFWPKKYRFTREKSPGLHNPLTIAQRNFYESNGYIIIDDCVSRRTLDLVRLSKQGQRVQNQQLDAQSSGSDFVDEFLLDKLLVKNARLSQYVKCFCDERFMLMTHRLIEQFQANEEIRRELMDKQGLNMNQANIESQLLSSNHRQMLFRDWIYLPFRPIDKVVGTIVALEPIEHVILVVPGTHKVGQCTISSTLENISAAYDSSQEKMQSAAAQVSREIYESSPSKLSALVEKSRKGFRYINLKPGQTLFYHPGLVHGFSSDLINYNRPQLAALAYYAAADCEFVDLTKSLALNEAEQQVDDGYDKQVPITLTHFGAHNPRDYRSWLDKPRMAGDVKAKL